MFKWLVKQLSAAEDDLDSLGSERGLEAFIARLPVTIPASTVEALSEQFENAGALGFTSDQLRRALKRLDERAQAPLDVLGMNLFEDRVGRNLSDTVWLTLARFYRNVNMGYRVCLEAMPAPDEQSHTERSDAVLMLCRAMAALGRYKTLLRMRHREIDATYWRHATELATRNAHSGSSSTLIELYPGTGNQTTFEREYLVALLFEAAPIANLLPAQMAALDLILRRFAASYEFSDSYRDATPFVFDLDGESVAKRWLKGLTPRPGQRFFGVADGYSQLAGLRKQEKAGGGIPDWLGDARLDVESYGRLLDLLIGHWSVEPPQRRNRRNQTAGQMLVVHGAGLVRRMIAASEYAKSAGRLSCEGDTPYDFKLFREVLGTVADPAHDRDAGGLSSLEMLHKLEFEGDLPLAETWTLTDVSETGMGAVVPAHGDWVRIGMLIGFRQTDSLEWRIAIVRRLSRSSRGRLSVGIQAIATTARCARLRIPASDDDAYWTPIEGTGDAYHDAILLRGGAAHALILEPGLFAGALDCMIAFDQRWQPVKLERSLEKGYDYERVAVTITIPSERIAT